MRLTVKYLQEQLEESKKNANRYYQQWQDAKNELHEKEKFEQAIEYNTRKYKDREIENLTEIIRILAKDPRLEMAHLEKIRDMTQSVGYGRN